MPLVLCQPMRTPEQLTALEETKAHGNISRTCRAAISNNSPRAVALQAFCAILQLGNRSTQNSNLPEDKLPLF